MKNKYWDDNISLGTMLETYYALKDTRDFESTEQEEWFTEFEEFLEELGNPQKSAGLV